MKNKIYKIGAGVVVMLFLSSTISAAVSSQSGLETNTDATSTGTQDEDNTATTDSSKYLSDMSVTARNKYINAKNEYQTTSVSYEDEKQDWLTARNKYRESKNEEDLTNAVEKANALVSGAERRLSHHLEKVIAYVEGERNLDDAEKQHILDELNSYTAWLEGKQQEITTATTKTEITAVARTVKAKWREVKQDTKRIAGQMMNAKILRLIEKAETAAAKIENMLQKLNEQGEDTTALEAWLEDFYEKIELAKQKYQAAREKYAEITDLDDAHDLLREGKAFLLEAKRYLKNAYKTLREIVKELKRYRDNEVTVNGIGTLIAEGNGYGLINGDGTVELSGEDTTLTVTDISGDMTITVSGFGEKTEIESNKWQYVGTGSATVTGTDMIVEVEGQNIHMTAEGTGSATLTGTGTYSIYKRFSDEKPMYTADDWTEEGDAVVISVDGGVNT